MQNFAYVFPGQGSQSLGMLAELAEQYPIVLDTFKKASDSLGFDVWALCQTGPEHRLNQTEFTQVAMLTADVAVYRVLTSLHAPDASYMAGHSLGEYAALVASNALTLEDAVRLVQQRGRLMQQTVPLGKGAMAAIVGLDDEAVRKVCQKATEGSCLVTPANFNALGQVVIAGHTPAVERAIALANEAGARMALAIPVSVPCHCPLLLEAAQAFEAYLNETPFRVPEVAVVSNVDLSVYQSDTQIRHLLKQQLYQPVRWVETIQMMKAKGVESVVECGPGKVLTGLVKRIDKSIKALNANDLASVSSVLAVLTASE